MDVTIRKNEKCFIGMPTCGYGYESAKLCFVACPSDDMYTLNIDAIKDIVESKQYECYIALKRIDPGNFAFCTKICSKIIQAQFCIVLLDPSTTASEKRAEYLNPNVHLEYGMMISQNKHIIPLQDEKYNLAFNISPLDTIKYTNANFKLKVTEAVDNAIKKFSQRTVPGQIPPGPKIYTFYNLLGYTISDVKINYNEFLYGLGMHLGFYLLDSKKNKYKYVGPFDYENPKRIILHTKLLIDNLVSTYEGLISSKPPNAKKEIFDNLINNISIDIIVPPSFRKEDILHRIEQITDKKYKYSIHLCYRTDIENKVEEEYKNIGNVELVKKIAS